MPMLKLKIVCPDCGAVVITGSPQAVIWEHCPSCHRHVWDIYDAIMAEVYVPARFPEGIRSCQADN